jgi:hypothetical protein
MVGRGRKDPFKEETLVFLGKMVEWKYSRGIRRESE